MSITTQSRVVEATDLPNFSLLEPVKLSGLEIFIS